MSKIRNLEANEIEVRVGMVKDSGMGLLLYKDSRVDMKILDETYGALYWQREHKEIKSVLYSGVSVYNSEIDQWITKWDAGVESNTDAQKGEASDSFKRACVNFGIGRSLYTAPFIWVKGYDKYEKFSVKEISYDDNDVINHLVIVDGRGNIAYNMGGSVPQRTVQPQRSVPTRNTQSPQRQQPRANGQAVTAMPDTSAQPSITVGNKYPQKPIVGEVVCNCGSPRQIRQNPDGSKYVSGCKSCNAKWEPYTD